MLKNITHTLLFHNGFNVAHVSTWGRSWVRLLFWLLPVILYRTHVRRLVCYCVHSTAFLSIDYFLLNYGNMNFYHSREFTQVTYAHNNIHSFDLHKTQQIYMYIWCYFTQKFLSNKSQICIDKFSKNPVLVDFNIWTHNISLSNKVYSHECRNFLTSTNSPKPIVFVFCDECEYIGASIVITLTCRIYWMDRIERQKKNWTNTVTTNRTGRILAQIQVFLFWILSLC